MMERRIVRALRQNKEDVLMDRMIGLLLTNACLWVSGLKSCGDYFAMRRLACLFSTSENYSYEMETATEDKGV